MELWRLLMNMIGQRALTNVPQLPLHVAEEFMDMNTEANCRISFTSFK